MKGVGLGLGFVSVPRDPIGIRGYTLKILTEIVAGMPLVQSQCFWALLYEQLGQGHHCCASQHFQQAGLAQTRLQLQSKLT